MPVSFSKIKETELDRILWEIETYLGEIGRSYAEDARRDGKYNPELMDPSKYRTEGEESETLKNKHKRALEVYRAESLEDLRFPPRREFEAFVMSMDPLWLYPEEEYLELCEKYARLGVFDASFEAGVLKFVGYGCDPDPRAALDHFLSIEGPEDDRLIRAGKSR